MWCMVRMVYRVYVYTQHVYYSGVYHSGMYCMYYSMCIHTMPISPIQYAYLVLVWCTAHGLSLPVLLLLVYLYSTYTGYPIS